MCLVQLQWLWNVHVHVHVFFLVFVFLAIVVFRNDCLFSVFSNSFYTCTHTHTHTHTQLINQFVESERLYVNQLEVLDFYFYQPFKMLAVFKPDIFSTLQLESLFLNRFVQVSTKKHISLSCLCSVLMFLKKSLNLVSLLATLCFVY